MPAYTSVLQKPLETIFWEDDNFMEELLQVVRLFRPFSAAITEFISEHGYQGDTSDIDAKVAFIRAAFAKADMDAPREVREWFTLQQPIKRDTVFQICFAFGLDGGETDEFFRRIFTRERSFNCHQMPEAIYYFCLNNGLTWTDAMDIQSSVPLSGKEKTNGDIVYTGSIIAELNNLQDKDDLIHWLNDNIDKFAGSNVTAYETIRRLWEEVSGPDGLLIQERKSLPSIHDDAATGKRVNFARMPPASDRMTPTWPFSSWTRRKSNGLPQTVQSNRFWKGFMTMHRTPSLTGRALNLSFAARLFLMSGCGNGWYC